MRTVGETSAADDVRQIVARLTDYEPLDRRTRVRLVARLARLLTGSGRRLVDVVIDVTPHIPVRDLRTLRRHYRGLDGDALATALVANATRMTAAVGAAGGVVSSLEVAAPPVLLSASVQIAAETLAVVAIEVKLVAELHEVYGRPAIGTPTVRGAAYLGSWMRQRGVDPSGAGPSLTGAVSGAARRELRQRLLRRAGRNATTVVPFLAGAVAGAALNQRETRRLGDRLLRDLRR